MNERLQAAVGARIGEFKKKMKEVNAITKKTATGATKKFDADVRDVAKASTRVAAMSKRISRTVTKKFKADTKSFFADVTAASTALGRLPKRVAVTIEARTKKFNSAMERVANVTRTFSEVSGSMMKGGLMTFFPALVPGVAAFTGAIGAAGTSVGVLGGALGGLASSAGLAGAGFAGLTSVMIPAITRLSEAHKAIMDGKKAMSDFSQPIQSVLQNVFELKNQFNQLQQSVQGDLFSAFNTGLEVAQLGLKRLTPGIQNVVKAFDQLMTAFQDTVKNASDVQKTFAWFNDRAGEAFRRWGKIAGNALRGVMNLLRAFDPLAQTMEKGLMGMTQQWAKWTAGLSKSDKFQQFIEYVRTNGPKLLSIVGNITKGLTGIFTAFAPMSADMLTGLQKLTARFKKWGQTLGQNKQFQEFADYIRQNGPKVIKLIGQVATFAVELGKAMAPLGSKLLDVANGFMKWLNKMMQTQPWFAKMAGGLATVMGAIKVLSPVVIGMKSVFGGTFGKILAKFIPFKGKMTDGFKKVGGKGKEFGKKTKNVAGKTVKAFGRMMKRATVWAARMAAAWVTAMGPIGWITTTVVALVALVIANWDKVKKYTIKAWKAVSEFLSNTFEKITGWVEQRFPRIYNLIKQYMQMAWDIIKSIWQYIKESFQNVLKFLKSLVKGDFKGMKEAIQAQMESAQKLLERIWKAIKGFLGPILKKIWNSIKSAFQTAKEAVQSKLQEALDIVKSMWGSIKARIEMRLIRIRNNIKKKFQQMKESIQDKLQQARERIQSIWNSVMEFFRGIDLFQIGKDIIQGLIDGIGSMANAVKEKVSDVASGITKKVKSVLQIASPSKVMKKYGGFVGEGLVQGMGSKQAKVGQAASKLATAITTPLQDVQKTIANTVSAINDAARAASGSGSSGGGGSGSSSGGSSGSSGGSSNSGVTNDDYPDKNVQDAIDRYHRDDPDNPHDDKYFHDGGPVGTANLMADEVPAILQKGEYVLSRNMVRDIKNAGQQSGGHTQQDVNVTQNFYSYESTPSENARKTKQQLRDLAMEGRL